MPSLPLQVAKIHAWFQQGSLYVYPANADQHHANTHRILPGTCVWLETHDDFSAWRRDIPSASILWFRGPPGVGKTITCSYATSLIKRTEPSAAVAYYFYRSDQGRQSVVASQILSVLAQQIFERYQIAHSASMDHTFEQISLKSLCQETLEEAVKHMVESLSRTYIFLDGLDEEADSLEVSRWTHVAHVLDFFVQLSQDLPHKVRLLCSSQHRDRIDKILQAAGALIRDIREPVREDVKSYLENAIGDLENLQGEKNAVLEVLQSRAEGNFLWARLMAESLQSEATNLDEIRTLIDKGLPRTFFEYYSRIFGRITGRSRRALAW